jgi:hypothetical protein
MPLCFCFDLTDCLETRQQTLVLLLSNCCCRNHQICSDSTRTMENTQSAVCDKTHNDHTIFPTHIIHYFI